MYTMDRIAGGVAKTFLGGVLLIVVIAVTLFLAFTDNKTPTEISTVTDNTNNTDIQKPTKKDTGNNQKSEDTFAEPKGVSQTTEAQNDNSQSSQRPSYNTPVQSKQTTTTPTVSPTPPAQPDQESINNPSEQSTDPTADDEARLHGQIYSGGYNVEDNTYPWKDYCSNEYEPGTIFTIGGYPACECTSYVAWMVYANLEIILSDWGNAYLWDNRASNEGYVVDNTPTPKSIGQTDNGAYGHVFWVEQVNPDGSIVISEYNNSATTYLYSGNNQSHDFGSTTIPAQYTTNYRYIHLDQRAW